MFDEFDVLVVYLAKNEFSLNMFHLLLPTDTLCSDASNQSQTEEGPRIKDEVVSSVWKIAHTL